MIKLYCTPLSHFSRKVRFVLDFHSIPYRTEDVGNVIEGTKKKFADNPLSQVPVLVDRDTWLIDSDHISAYLVKKFAPQDELEFFSQDAFNLNSRAIFNGAMAEEVKVILAKRTGVPIEEYPYFDRSLATIHECLYWAEKNASKFGAREPKYRDLHLVALWDHLAYYELVPLTTYPQLAQVVSEISRKDWVKQTQPWRLKPKPLPVQE